MEKVVHRCIFLCLFFFSYSVLAKSPVISELSQLISQNNYQQAYLLGSKHQFELEGDPEFDFYFGLAALNTQNFETALFNFERLSTSFPQIHRYRLELARSYFYLGNLDRAEQEFQKVLADNPPLSVQRNVLSFIEGIKTQRSYFSSRWYGSINISGGYDSNINSATNIAQMEIPLSAGLLWVVPLGSTERQQNSAFAQVSGLIGHNKPFNRATHWGVQAAFGYKANQSTHDYNLGSLSVQTDLRHVKGAWQFRPVLTYSQYWLAADSLQNEAKLSTEAYWSLSKQWQPFARLGLSKLNHDFNKDLERLQYQFELGTGFHHGAFNSQLSLSYHTDKAAHDIKAYMRNALGLNFTNQYRLNTGELYGQMFIQDSRYQAELAVFSERKDERLYQLLFGYRHYINKKLSGYVQASHLENRSQLDIYQYRRSLVEAGLTLAF